MKTYLMVWIDEEEKWYFFTEGFDEKQFKDGFVAYSVLVDENDIIILDEWKTSNRGKKFNKVYDVSLWN